MAEQKKKGLKDQFNPSAGDTPQARAGAAIGGAVRGVGAAIGNVAGFLADSAATAGQTGVMGAGRDLPNAGRATPAQQGLRGAPVTQRPPQAPTDNGQVPAGGSTPPPASTPPASTPPAGETAPVAGTAAGTTNPNNVARLREMGVTNPNAPAVADSRAAIRAGSPDYVNLGNYGQAGGPNIYGKSSTPGGRLNTFVGAGTPDPNNPTTNLTTAGPGTNSALYNNADPMNLRNGGVLAGAGPRAGQARFGGGAGGRGSVSATEIRRINQRADRAFSDALKSGMNTKAASRIAESLRAGATQLTDIDQNQATRDNAQTYADASRYNTDAGLVSDALRQQGAMSQAEREAQAAIAERQFGLFQDQFVDAEGKPDKAGFSRMVQNAGGYERFLSASPETQQRLATRGSGLNNVLNNVNALLNKKGIAVSTIGELTQGSTLKQTGASILDALRSENISLSDIWGDKITLPNGDLITPEDFWGMDKESFVTLSAEDRKGLVELVGE